MGLPFNRIQTDNADLDRVQKNIADLARQIPAASSPSVVTVTKDYRATGAEDVIHVDASAGPVRITLTRPAPNAKRLTVTQINLNTTAVNQVTVTTPDGTNLIAGASSYQLDGSGTGSVTFTCDGSQYWPTAGASGNPPAPGLVYVGVPPIYVAGNVISFKPTPTPPPAPFVTPWVAPVGFGDGMYQDATGAETWRAEQTVDFTGAPSTLTLYWWFQSLSSAGTGTFQLRIGGSAYQALDGAVIATWAETSSTLTGRSVVVGGLVAPASVQRVTLTARSSAPGARAQVQGVSVVFR